MNSVIDEIVQEMLKSFGQQPTNTTETSTKEKTWE